VYAVEQGGTGLLEPGVGEHLPAGPRALPLLPASARASALCTVHSATLGGSGFIASSFCDISPPWLRTIFFRQGCTFAEDSIGDCCCVGGGLGVSVFPGGDSWHYKPLQLSAKIVSRTLQQSAKESWDELKDAPALQPSAKDY